MTHQNDPEIERIAKKMGDEYRYKLTHPDFVAFESDNWRIRAAIPAHSVFQCGTIVKCSRPHCTGRLDSRVYALVPHHEMLTVGSRKLICLASGWDSDGFFCELTGDISSVPIHVHWDDRADRIGVLHPDDFEELGITLEELLEREWRPFVKSQDGQQ